MRCSSAAPAAAACKRIVQLCCDDVDNFCRDTQLTTGDLNSNWKRSPKTKKSTTVHVPTTPSTGDQLDTRLSPEKKQQQQRHDQRPARLSTKSNCTNNNPEAVTSGLVDGGENRVLIGPARKIESVVPGTVLV
ncbi:uncharacterized protein Dana_GF27063 [Drosophila ananassae]|uniref:Uncharacterized protein n=1 Tax=Drosophila ananassae TaxID=7217 RepID=A0A0P8XXY2_DROAN|nr:uncharacterized protein Dana_GF27063 [Drosophila ananassae]